MLLFYLSAAVLVVWIILGLELIIGMRRINYLRDIPVATDTALPKISIIIPARNEERNIREALQSILQQDYPSLEFIIINDRSTDNTGTILNELAAADSRLTVYTITDLPPGWLGKNHALHYGAARAAGEIILFSDADVVMQPSAISRAVNYLQKNTLDHLTIAPVITVHHPVYGIFIMSFCIFFLLYTLPWRAAKPDNKKHIGVGAFNMVRADVYRAIGGHEPIALRPDDDLKLGKLIKINGYRQGFLHGTDLMMVEWYASIREMIHGLMKNAFAGVNYSIATIIGTTFLQLVLNVWPFIALFVTSGPAWLFSLLAVLIILVLGIDSSRPQKLNPWYCLGFPLGTLMFLYILWRAMILNLKDDGIYWRGTHYSLAKLKANKL